MGGRFLVGSAAMVAVLALVGCSSTGSDGVARTSTSTASASPTTTTAATADGFTAAPIEWKECEQGECATVEVPLDHTDPDGPTIGLAVARASRADDARRIGTLWVNPGGPGASGVEIVEYVATQLPDTITDRFDIVSWDPRGSGESAPVDCGPDLDARFAPDTSPDDAAELTALEAAARELVETCVAKTGARIRHVASAATVQDLDILRAALGDEQLTYLGLSYGTFIGALYAERYPERVRALVLDGAVDPALPVEDVAVQQARGFDDSLRAFLDWCEHDADCTFADGTDVRAAYAELAARVDASPIDLGGDTFGPTQFDLAVAAVLYGGEAEYRLLARGLLALQRGDAGRMHTFYKAYVGKTGDTFDAGWPAFVAIGCSDGPNLDLAAMEALQQRAAAEAPDFGAATIGLGFECAFWPYPATRRASTPIRAVTEHPLVVVGNTGDPATPLVWAEGLAAQLGNARLVTVGDRAHTASLNGINCLDDILTRYLVDLVAPAVGARCASEGAS